MCVRRRTKQRDDWPLFFKLYLSALISRLGNLFGISVYIFLGYLFKFLGYVLYIL